MAFYTGYITIPHSTYDEWKNAVAGNGYNADGYYGDQCWDLTAEFWYNVGFPQGFPHTGANHYASECWTVSRSENISYNGTQYFDLIYNLSDVKRGDVVVFDGTVDNPPGHIGFADSDFNPSTPLSILGQNQGTGGVPTPEVNPEGGTTANVNTLNASEFLGAFRFKGWQPIPPTPTSRGKTHFKWVLYARKLREQR